MPPLSGGVFFFFFVLEPVSYVSSPISTAGELQFVSFVCGRPVSPSVGGPPMKDSCRGP